MVIIENPETGEVKQLGMKGSFNKPWRIKEVIPEPKQNNNVRLNQAKLAVFATQLGLPVARFLDIARILLKKDCPYCKLGTQVLRRISELGEEKALSIINRILIAKDNNDAQTLEQIRQELNG